ncbi:hypothetical protein MCAMS1_02400 [biofilm metagenome]
MKKLFALINTLFLAGCSLFGIQTEDSPVYGLMEEYDPIEIRHYYPYLTVQTEDSGDYDAATEKSFFRLFDYINGKNQTQQKLTMTAPVLQASKGEKIQMTAPVFQAQSGKTWTMRFVLPLEYDLATAPKPSDPKVTLVEIPEKKVAVLRFTGFFSENTLSETKAELMAWLKEKKIKPLSEPLSAGYNPPWTIPFLRRNEIHVDIE